MLIEIFSKIQIAIDCFLEAFEKHKKGTAYFRGQSRVLSTKSLLIMLESVRRVLRIDDDLPAGQKVYEVREFSDFRQQADAMEMELKARGVSFEPVDWSL